MYDVMHLKKNTKKWVARCAVKKTYYIIRISMMTTISVIIPGQPHSMLAFD